MKKYYTQALTTKGIVETGWVKAENSFHAMSIAKIIAKGKGYDVTGATSCTYCSGK